VISLLKAAPGVILEGGKVSSLIDLIQYIQNEADTLDKRNGEARIPLTSLFQTSINKTMEEIKLGANSIDFPDFVVINLIINAAQAGYSVLEIKVFVDSLSQPSNNGSAK
jgi:hypothetical protein